MSLPNWIVFGFCALLALACLALWITTTAHGKSYSWIWLLAAFVELGMAALNLPYALGVWS